MHDQVSCMPVSRASNSRRSRLLFCICDRTLCRCFEALRRPVYVLHYKQVAKPFCRCISFTRRLSSIFSLRPWQGARSGLSEFFRQLPAGAVARRHPESFNSTYAAAVALWHRCDHTPFPPLCQMSPHSTVAGFLPAACQLCQDGRNAERRHLSLPTFTAGDAVGGPCYSVTMPLSRGAVSPRSEALVTSVGVVSSAGPRQGRNRLRSLPDPVVPAVVRLTRVASSLCGRWPNERLR